MKPRRHLSFDGYVMVPAPGHPRADRYGFVREHILVVEHAMGKFLRRSAEVHHLDENRQHNAGSNLVACDSMAYHKLLHVRQRALRECGHASWRICRYCKRWDAPENLYINYNTVQHRDCHAAKQLARWRAKQENAC